MGGDYLDGMTTTSGYSSTFLSSEIPFPELEDTTTAPGAARTALRLDYVHFSVLFQRSRRLAAATAVNIDGAALVDLGRGDDWHFDVRLPEEDQTGPTVYAGNDLDRGHLVRRRDPVWGSGPLAAQANFDTFSFTNAAPQAGSFNQSKLLWLGLEDYVLDYAATSDSRISVFTGPVLAPDDPPYRGTGIPRLFWKIAAWIQAPGLRDTAGPVLAATGYVLDQAPALEDLDLEEKRRRAELAGDPPPLGPFRTFQVPIPDIAALTGLRLGPLEAADRLDAAPIPAEVEPLGGIRLRWRELSTRADLHW